ncbi:MAG: 1-(5-phosphoribosyl)-5-[(5-phosphoribosylamino)methylideneamino]imidazole-4-carboxamide isomerase [Gammaproteobacteria bacterium]|nr:1-(5-phosphoribosyl)-5-[(5-phosphoribosylamino)methylideneamino]imidazole-4-carboxamide isomerase [Gammaproteobacteria bacterium]MDH3856871.1 1-(5-phosphoribosyl)-5-[(5-phosphoribosylamino)methylideneamino]imidazole-4-carboxamide isomerase [Gammaproteobacteria bacterium]
MILIPAIDLKEGHCVRLRQGNMDESTVFSDDPVSMAGKWVEQGCNRLHLVDLDGAFEGAPANADVIQEICSSFPDMPIQIGGGIRSIETVESYLEAGVSYVIIGTMAVKRPEFITQLCAEFPGNVIIGLDARDGMVAVHGWAEGSDHSAQEMALRFEDQGVAAIVYTDISRDGMMQGVNVEATRQLAESISVPVIASGGVTDMECIIQLNAVKDSGIEGVIIGRALYERTIILPEAQAYIDQN